MDVERFILEVEKHGVIRMTSQILLTRTMPKRRRPGV